MPETIDASIEDAVYSLAASPAFADDGICFAARPSGLYRSTDGGQSWQPAYASLNLEAPLATTAVILSPGFAGDSHVFAGVPGGILRSMDGGQTWQVATLPSPPPLVSSLVISPDFERDGVILAATVEDGVFRSADRGSRWSAWNFGLLDLKVLTLAISPDFAADETLFAGTDSGLFRSTNGGRAWREVDLPVGFTPVLSLAFSPHYAGDGLLFAGTEDYGLFSSADRGRSWTRLAETTLTGNVNGIFLSPDFPTRPDVLVLLGNGLFVSRDGGQTWQEWPVPAGEPLPMMCASAPLGLDPGAPLLVGLADGRVLRL